MKSAALMDRLIPEFEATLDNVASAMTKSFGADASWGVAGFREESLVFLLAETMRKLEAANLRYEPCFGDKTRADLSWGESGDGCTMLEAKVWWWSGSLTAVLDDIRNKVAFTDHRGERYAVVFSVDDVSCKEGAKTWATLDGARRWMQDLVEEDRALAKQWSFVGCAATKSPYVGTSWTDEGNSRRRDGVFVAAFYRLK